MLFGIADEQQNKAGNPCVKQNPAQPPSLASNVLGVKAAKCEVVQTQNRGSSQGEQSRYGNEARTSC